MRHSSDAAPAADHDDVAHDNTERGVPATIAPTSKRDKGKQQEPARTGKPSGAQDESEASGVRKHGGTRTDASGTSEGGCAVAGFSRTTPVNLM